MPTNETKFDFFRKHRQPTTLKRMACMVVPTINHACHQFQAGRLPVGLKIAQNQKPNRLNTRASKKYHQARRGNLNLKF